MVSGEIYYECTDTVQDGVSDGIADGDNVCRGWHGVCNGNEESGRESGAAGGSDPSLVIPDVNDVLLWVL